MLYLRLFHGRINPAQQMSDYGSDGPVFGPLVFCHTTYSANVKMGLPDGNCQELTCYLDMLFYAGVYYGDWSVFTEESFRKNKFKITKYDPAKAQLPQA